MAKIQRSQERYENRYDGTVYKKRESLVATSPFYQEVETLDHQERTDEETLIMLCKNQQLLLKRLLQTLKSYLKDPSFPPPRPGYTQRKIMTEIIEQIQASIEEQRWYVLSVERDILNFKHRKEIRDILRQNSQYRRLVDDLTREREKTDQQIQTLVNELQTRKIETSTSDADKEGLVSVKVSSKISLADDRRSSHSYRPFGLSEVINLIKENTELKMKLKNKNTERTRTTSIMFTQEQDGNPCKAAFQIGSPTIIDKSQSRIDQQTSITRLNNSQRVHSKQKIDIVYSQEKRDTLRNSLASEKKRLEDKLMNCKREMETVRSLYDSIQKEMRFKKQHYDELKAAMRLQNEEVRKLQRDICDFQGKLAGAQQSEEEENDETSISDQNRISINAEINEDWRRDADPNGDEGSWNVTHYRGSFDEEFR